MSEEWAARCLFFEMAHVCRAYHEINESAICFDEVWFKENFRDNPERVCWLTYSDCQPLLSKYPALFKEEMSQFEMKLLDVDNLNMLNISFESEESFCSKMN